MSPRWRTGGGVVLVVCALALVASTGVAFAQTPAGGTAGHHAAVDRPAATHARSLDDRGRVHEEEEEEEHGGEGLGDWLPVVGGLFLLGAVTSVPTYRYLDADRGPEELTRVHLAGALLALFTAAVHLYLFVDEGEVVMLLAGLGFVGGVVLLFAGVARRYLYPVGALFTLVQIPLWVAEGMPYVDSFAPLDKAAQATLVVLLGYLTVRRWRT